MALLVPLPHGKVNTKTCGGVAGPGAAVTDPLCGGRGLIGILFLGFAQRFIQKTTARCLLVGMKPKFALVLALCVLLAVLTIVILSGRSGRNSPTRKTQSGLVITQDGKLTVLSPEGSANFKVIATMKSLTNTSSAITNSSPK